VGDEGVAGHFEGFLWLLLGVDLGRRMEGSREGASRG